MEEKKSWFDTTLNKFISRKLMVLIIVLVMFGVGRLTKTDTFTMDQVFMIILSYIGTQGLHDIVKVIKGN